MLFLILRHEIKLAFTKGSGIFNLLAFFIIAATLFPFGVGPDAAILKTIGVGVIWVCALLTSMLSLPVMFARDYEDGMLEQFLLQGYAAEMVALSKILAHWCVASLPLIVVAPFIAYMFQLDGKSILLMQLSLLLGTPTLSLIGASGAALTLGAKRAGSLLGLLVLPLYIPVLIFAVGGMDIALQNDTVFSAFYMLMGLLLGMLPISIIACTFALKTAVEEG